VATCSRTQATSGWPCPSAAVICPGGEVEDFPALGVVGSEAGAFMTAAGTGRRTGHGGGRCRHRKFAHFAIVPSSATSGGALVERVCGSSILRTPCQPPSLYRCAQRVQPGSVDGTYSHANGSVEILKAPSDPCGTLWEAPK
jgi:hypothetical protein